MHVNNTYATRTSGVQTAPNAPPSGRPYYNQPNCVRYEFKGSWSGNDSGEYGVKSIVVWAGANKPTTATRAWYNTYGNNSADANHQTGSFTSWGDVGTTNGNPWLYADTTYTWRSYFAGYWSTGWNLKTLARTLALDSSSLTNPQKTSIDVSVVWYPNTHESSATMTLQYKKLSDTTWTTWDTTSGAKTGYSSVTFAVTVTGLESGTTYQFQAIVHRTVSPTEEDTTFDLGSKATLPASPTISTEAATGITDSYAVLNADIDPNTIDCTVSFQYGETSGALDLETATQSVTGDGSRIVAYGQDGLDDGTTYYFRVKVTYDLGAGPVTIYGSELSFATGADQGALARAEDLMQTLYFDGQYGTGRFVTFTLKTKATDGSDQYYTATIPTKSQCKVYLTTSAGVTTGPSNATNDPTQPGGAGTPVFSLELENAEMAAETVDVVVTSAGATFRDQHIQIRTAQRLSELDLDATNGPTDATALTAIGNGAGDGIKAVGGTSGLDINAILESNWLRVGAARTQATPDATKIRLDAASSSTDDYYNGCIVALIGGTGVGQARIAIDYVGGADPDTDGNREITVDSAWLGGNVPDDNTIYALAPGPRMWEMKSPGELDDLPTETSSYGEFLRLLFQRFAFKIDQNADYQTWYKSDNANTFVSRAVEDDGNTQRLYKLST